MFSSSSETMTASADSTSADSESPAGLGAPDRRTSRHEDRDSRQRYALLPVGRFSPGRSDLEKFVAAAFQRKHGARVHSFMPTLLGLRSPAGEVCGVAGYRLAGYEPLYLEQYLDQPVEVALSARLSGTVIRDQIIEIGNFAGATCRSARHLATLLPRYFLERGQTWAVFTATGLIREILEGLGVPLLELVGADRARVAGTGDDWGAYYETDPRVMAAHIPSALELSPGRRRRDRTGVSH